MQDLDPVARINYLREKVLKGEPVTLEEAREAINLLRQRRHDTIQAKVEKEKKVALPINLNELFVK